MGNGKCANARVRNCAQAPSMNKWLFLFLLPALLVSDLWGFGGGDGTAGNPWQITTRAELEAVNNDLTAHYILMNDIDLGATNYTQAVIAPWGDGTEMLFTGVFDGNYKTIRNLTVDGGTTNGTLGLFGSVQYGGIIKQLRLQTCNITGTDSLGLIAGSMWERALISDCFASGTVRGRRGVGGLVGRCEMSSIKRCAAEGHVWGDDSVGGLVGFHEGHGIKYDTREGLIIDCYSACSVTGNDSVGGLIGTDEQGAVFNCYACGYVTGNSKSAAFVGDSFMSSVCACFWNKESSGQMEGAPGYYGGEGLTSAEMQQRVNFEAAGWHFIDPVKDDGGSWLMPGNGFPVLNRLREHMRRVPELMHLDLPGVVSSLRQAGFTIGTTNFVNSLSVMNGNFVGISVTQGEVYFTNAPPVDVYVSAGSCGDGSALNPYPVACEADLLAVNNDLGAHYILVRDICHGSGSVSLLHNR